MKTPKKLRQYVIRHIEDIRDTLYLHQWVITTIWKKSEGPRDQAADINTNHSYMTATINLYPCIVELWEEKDAREIFSLLVHEMCHILTDELYQKAWDAVSPKEQPWLEGMRERNTEHLANIVMRLYQPKDYKIDD